MRGRKPKPKSLKILDGTRADRINEHEPRLPNATLDPPAWLDEKGVEHWKELAPILLAAGLLTVGDRQALAMLCDDYSLIMNGRTPWLLDSKTGQRDKTLEQAWEAKAEKARDRYRRMLTEFGLTPSSRSRIKSAAAPAKDDLEDFLAESL